MLEKILNLLRKLNTRIHFGDCKMCSTYRLRAEDAMRKVRDASRGQVNTQVDPFMEVNLSTEDISPRDPSQREAYVGRVASYYKDIGSDQIKLLYNNVVLQLERGSNTDKEDAILKGALFALRALDKQFKTFQSEVIGNVINNQQ